MYAFFSVFITVYLKLDFSDYLLHLTHEQKPYQSLLRTSLVVTGSIAFFFAQLLATGEIALAITPDMTEAARSQIQSLILEKEHRTRVQTKLSSHLLHARSMKNGKAITQGVRTLRSGIRIERDGSTEVDVTANVSRTVLAQIESLGGSIINQYPAHHALRVRINMNEIEHLASFPQIDFIQPAVQMMTNSHDSLADNTSEGDAAHQANVARSTFGVDGTGITIGVLSNGVNSLAARQASGDLPSRVTVLPGQAGSGDEGTAMLEIVHDLAPGAHLLFATAFGGQAAFASNIEALRLAGANIIVDDVFYFAEPVFQDGMIAQAVNNVSANGTLYFSSAGNSGNLNAGTAGVWEGDYTAMTAPLALGSGPSAHDFGGGINANQITKDPPLLITLSWADPTGHSTNDYDLFLLSPDLSTVLASSTNIQNGTSDPYEQIFSGPFNDINNQIVIIKTSGEDRYLHLSTHRGRLALATDGQIAGHATAADAFAIAAVNIATAGGGAFVGGSANPVESFSSDGPRRMFYTADGSPLTPGNLSSTGGIIREKPDLAAADGVATSTPGFHMFFGTSAAAPHAAAIAGLLLQADSTMLPVEVRSALHSTALDIEGVGFDRDSGYGLIDALTAVQQVVLSTAYPLAIKKNGSGSGSFVSTPLGQSCGPTCPGHTAQHPNGTSITFTPKPAIDSVFGGWNGGGCHGTGSCTVTVTEATTVIATFHLIPAPIYPLAIKKSGNGSGSFISTPLGQSCGPTCPGHTAHHPNGTSISFTTKPTIDSVFDGWDGGGCSGTGSCTVTVTEAITVTAMFSLKPPTPN